MTDGLVAIVFFWNGSIDILKTVFNRERNKNPKMD